MRCGCLFIACLLCTCGVLGQDVPSRMFALDGHGRAGTYYYPDDDRRRITALADVVTPHIAWARPMSGGPVHVLAIAQKVNGRWPVELAQRFDLDVTTVYGQAADMLGAIEGEGLFVQGRADVEARLLQALNEPIDVVVSDIAVNVLGEAVHQRLAELSADGVGYVGPTGGMDLSARAVGGDAQREMVAAAVPLAGLRLLSAKFASGVEAGGKIVKLWTHKTAGRVADLSAYPRDGERPDANRLQYLHLPSMEWEAWCSLLGRAALWAAGRAPAASAIQVRWPDDVIDRDAMPYLLAVDSDDQHLLAVRVWDADGRLRWRGDEPVIPRLAAGRYFIGLQLHSGREVLDWAFGTLSVRSAIHIQSIELDGQFKRPGQEVMATVKLSGPPPGGKVLRVEVIDNFGRSVSRHDLPAAVELSHGCDFAESLHIYNYVNVQLMGSDGEVIDEDRRGFFVARAGPPSDDLVMMVWEAGAGFGPRRRILLKQFAALGMHAALTGPADASALPVIESAAMANAHTLLYTYRRSGRMHIDANGVVHPCLSSPSHRSKMIARLKADVARTIGLSPLCYYLGDDVNYVKPGQDACWSASCRALLAGHVERKYETIDALNAAWGTTYATFQDVEPIRRSDAMAGVEQGDLAPLCHWIDHQVSTDAMFAGFFRELGEAVRQVAPRTRANMNGDGWAWPGMGFDHWQLAEAKNITIQYPNLMAHEIFRCAASPDALRGTWYGGYGLYNYKPYYVQDFLPWWCTFRRINMHGIFYGGQSPKSGEAVLGADLGPYEGFEKILTNLNELRAGTSKLLSNARYDNDGVAMLYSPPSLHATMVLADGLPKAVEWDRLITGADRFIYMQSWEAMSHLLRDIGFSFDVVPSSHLADGRFLDANFRVLVLPLTLRLSEAEAQTIRRFVRAGGTVIADALPGVFDGRARAGHGGMLGDVLGVKLAGGVPGEKIVTQSATTAGGESLGRIVVDAGVTLDGATPAAATDEATPILLVHEYGQGRAVLLNVLSRDYQVWRTKATEMPFRDAIARLLANDAALAAKFDFQVAARSEDATHRIRVTEFHHYELGGASYVGLLRHARLRPDEEAEMADQRPKPGWLTFDRKAHVYDVRNRMYRGLTDKVEDVIYPARAELYALLPYEVRDLKLRAKQHRNAVVLDAQIVSGDAAVEPTTHVLHIEIIDPHGRIRPELSRNVVAEHGRLARERFFIGHNAAAGAWRVKVRDVASGMERTVEAPVAPTISGLRVEGAELYKWAAEQWTIEPGGRGAVEWVTAADDERHLAIRDGASVAGPQFEVIPFQYYELVFRVNGPASHWAALFYDTRGNLLDADNYSSLPTAETGWVEQRFCFRARATAASAAIKLYAHEDMKLLYDAVRVRPVGRKQVARWADSVYATMPAIAYGSAPSQKRPKHLSRTIDKLGGGRTVTVVMLGDSMINDAGNSAWDVLLERMYPGARVHLVTSVRGATGMHWFAENDRVQQYVIDYKPDLLILGGASHRGRAEPYRQVILQVRRHLDPDILITTPAIFPSAPPGGFAEELSRLADEEHAAFLDMAMLWRQYLKQNALGDNPPQFRRDGGHANARGKQFHARVLEKLFALPQ